MDISICKRTCENEHLILSPYAAFADKSKGRKREEEQCPIRTVFQRDRDRIIHCSAFRRLKHKTQVFLSPEGDYFRTRLTHTLEVTQIARTIARALKLNEDLTEAIGLGHDLGHTPFGHAGERALNSVCDGGFRHFEQSVRVVDRLEKGGQGLNLTDEVRNGILCHTRGEEAYTLEGRIVKVADKIAYLNHDIDDAIRAKIITENDIPCDIRQTLGYNKSSRINTLVRSVIENSENRNEIVLDENINQAFEALNAFMFQKVYTNPVCKGEESKAIDMIIRMYYYFADNPDKLTKEFYDIDMKEGSKRAATDYIAGMTDRYAVSKFRELFIPKSWYSY
ncbi:Deoxyguanosinetriphosphate triphosphohydrolase-like protein [bioreactor metagenome]|uniref:Deoxyguanosinetriphosphate triphosphohydrolase-like protein n=1 Tax=bioreactor metagenome TaxID=1076179 RepID=A0A645C2Z1_9ZZZZ